MPELLQHLFGKMFGDKGYISQRMLKELMQNVGVQVVTKLNHNMKQRLMPFGDQTLLRKRAVVETVIDQLKNGSQIEHSRHRSPVNCFVNIFCGLIAYCHQLKKPGIAMEHNLLCLNRTDVIYADFFQLVLVPDYCPFAHFGQEESVVTNMESSGNISFLLKEYRLFLALRKAFTAHSTYILMAGRE